MEINLFRLESDSKCKTPAERLIFKRIFFRFCLRGVSLFLGQKLDKLDPHVGDAACQIRACQLVFLFQEMLERNKKNYYESFCEKLKKEIQYATEGQPCSLAIMPEEIFFFGVSYFLTIFKLSDGAGGFRSIDHKKVARYFGISNSRALVLVHIAQRELCRISCDFIFRLSLRIGYPHHILLEKFLKKGDDEKLVLPCFFSSDVIWRYLKREKNPICFEIRDKFKLTQQGRVFFNKENLSIKPCFYMICHLIDLDGIEDYVKENSDEILYVTFGMHKQYPGLQLKPFSVNPFSVLREEERDLYKPVESFFCRYMNRPEVLSRCPMFHIKTKWISALDVLLDESEPKSKSKSKPEAETEILV